jgi:hypothetical protein
MKKQNLLIALAMILIAFIASSCASYSCPTYADSVEEVEEPCLWV